MSPTPAFLSPAPVPLLNPTRPFERHQSLRCSASEHQSSRRVFITQALKTAAVVLTGAAPVAAGPSDADLVQLPPRAKPRKVAWGYAAENGPSVWGTLSEDWALCENGQSQSPIAISYREAVGAGDAPRPILSTSPAKFLIRAREATPGAANRSLIAEQYIPRPPLLVGDAPPVDTYTPPPPAAVITIPDVATYALRSFHFHGGSSEHVLDGNRGALEVHFLFEKRSRAPPTPPPSTEPNPSAPPTSSETPTSSAGLPSFSFAQNIILTPASAEAADTPQLLVVAIMGFLAEESDPWFKDVIEKIPLITAEDARPAGIVMDLDLSEALPDLSRVNLYAYSGSLTVPPGTEGISWLVAADRMHVTNSDVETLMNLQGGANVRPLQPLNGRKIIRFPPIPQDNGGE